MARGLQGQHVAAGLRSSVLALLSGNASRERCEKRRVEPSACVSSGGRTGPDPLPAEINRRLASPVRGTRSPASGEKGKAAGEVLSVACSRRK